MDRRGTELRVGIAVIFALIVLVGGIIWIKGCQVAKREYVVRVAFDEVGGLTEGDPVTVLGVTRGSVKRIELGRAQVYVDLSVDKSIIITDDTEFIIRNIGLMGEKYVAIKLGKSNRFMRKGEVLSGRFESGVPEVVGEIGVALKDFEKTVIKVHDVLDQIEREGKISSTLDNLNQFSSSVKGTVEDNREDLRVAVEDLRYTSAKLKEFAISRGPEIDTTVTRITELTRDLDALVNKLASLSVSVEMLVQKVENGEGTLGRFVNDDTLYEEVQATLNEARSLIADIKKNPRRYLKFSLF
jgi:phospholipid/cholesterol/gamma-HCH transport system substrate-binding protein